MVRSSAGREYRSYEYVIDAAKNEKESLWTCLTCGAVVGPRRAQRDLHDAWHARHGD